MNLNNNDISLRELTISEINAINGGDTVAHDIGETVGYFFGYLYTAGPALVVKAATIVSVFK